LKLLGLVDVQEEEQKTKADDVYVCVTGSSVNLRAGPGTEYESVGLVHKGDQLKKANTEAWIAVEANDHVYWISDRYVVQQDVG